MNTFYKTTAALTCVLLMIAACGNTNAKNDRKKGKAKTEVKAKAVKELNYEQFNAKVYNIKADDLVYLGDKPAIVDFTASWCGPCQRIAPILEELATEYEGRIVIYKVDVDKNPELAQHFKVSSIPAVLYIAGGDKEPLMTIGARGKEKFKEEISSLLLAQ